MSKREKYVGFGAGAAVLLLSLNSFVYEPYMTALQAVKDGKIAAQQTLDEGALLTARRDHLNPVWQQLVVGGLKQNESLAQSQARQALNEWAHSAGVTLDSNVLEHTTQQGAFNISNFNISFNVQGNAGMRSIARMLWALETAKIPMHINDMKISTVHEGSDQLMVKLNVSTIYMADTTGSNSTGGGSHT